MAKILVLDDDPDYCEEICLALNRDGHQTLTTSNAKEAILVGLCERPDLLITDWMLGGKMDGLSVAEVLEIVCPNLNVILITGFASNDLKLEAQQQQVSFLLEKPFSAKEIKEKVILALKVNPLPNLSLPIAALEIDQNEIITYANSYANLIFNSLNLKSTGPVKRNTNTRPATQNSLVGLEVSSILNRNSDLELRSMLEYWVPLTTRKNNQFPVVNCRAREIPGSDKTILFFLSPENSSYMFEPIVHELLNSPPPEPKKIGINGHLLIIDDFQHVRRVTAAILKEFNCVCHTASSIEEAKDLFNKDKLISHIILDLELPHLNLEKFISTIRKQRPNCIFIGSCTICRDEPVFSKVNSLLIKPWSDEDLIEVLKSVGTARMPDYASSSANSERKLKLMNDKLH